MARSDSDAAEEIGTSGRGERAASSAPRRINVAVTPDMIAAIDRVIDREQVSLTEAVRRLIGYGDVMYRAVKEDGQTVFFRTEDGGEREIVLI